MSAGPWWLTCFPYAGEVCVMRFKVARDGTGDAIGGWRPARMEILPSRGHRLVPPLALKRRAAREFIAANRRLIGDAGAIAAGEPAAGPLCRTLVLDGAA